MVVLTLLVHRQDDSGFEPFLMTQLGPDLVECLNQFEKEFTEGWGGPKGILQFITHVSMTMVDGSFTKVVNIEYEACKGETMEMLYNFLISEAGDVAYN